MNTAHNLDLIDFKKPKDNRVFQDKSDNWSTFRKIRFTFAGDGEYAVVSGLDIARLNFDHFPANHIAFVNCNLDGALFKNTEFKFETAFINCSMKNADLNETLASDALFLDCDLTGVKISPISPFTQWTSTDLDGKDIPTIFNNCKIGDITKSYLIKNKCIFDAPAEIINDKLERIAAAPVLDL